MANFIEADVIQKIATEAEWLTQTRIPYKGQIMIVSDSSGKVVNIKVGDGINPFADLNYMFDSIQQNAQYVPITSNALPTPVADPAWGMVTGGTYTFGGVDVFTVPDGHWGIANYSSGVWSLVDMGELPIQDVSGLATKVELGATQSQVDKIETVFQEGEELVVSLTNFYINSDGVLISGSNYRASNFIPVVEGGFYKYKGKANYSSQNRAVYGYTADGTPVAEILGSIDSLGEYIPFSIPTGQQITQIRACTGVVASEVLSILGQDIISKDRVEELDSTIERVSETEHNLAKVVSIEDVFLTDNLTTGYLNASGAVSVSANWRTTEYHDVDEGDTLTYLGSTSGGVAQAIVGYNAASASTILLGTVTNGQEHKVLVPSGIVRVRASGTIAGGATVSFKLPVVKSSGSGGTWNTLKYDIGKSWNVVGHSIWWQDELVYSSTSTVAIGTQTLVKEKVTFTGYNKYAYSGRSLAGTSDMDTQSILQQKSGWVSADIWTFDSITNDFKLNRPIGTESDFLNNTGITTFYGALRLFHDRMKELNPNYLCICASPLQRDNGGYTSWSANTEGHTLKDYTDALLWVANRLSWRFVDQFNYSGINMENLTDNTLDGLHPNNTGYAKYAGLWISEFFKI